MKSYLKRKMKKYAKKAVAARRRNRRRNLQFKHYSFKFQLPPQIISTDGQAYVRVPTVSAQGPIGNGTASSPPSGGQLTNLTSNSSGMPNTGDWTCAYAPKLNDLANATSFRNMYDAYRIDRVTVEVQYLQNASSTGGTIQSQLPTFWMYFDQDDATVPGDIYAVIRKTGVRKFQPNAVRTSSKFSFVPRVAIAALNAPLSGTNTASMVGKPRQWIDCANGDISHFGFKMVVQDFPIPSAGAYSAVRLNYTYHVSFRSPLLTS